MMTRTCTSPMHSSFFHVEMINHFSTIVYNYPPKERWIVMDIYRDAKRRGIYPPLFTDPEGDSCFSIYQITWIKKRFFNVFFRNFRETTRHFSLRSQNSEYPRIFRVMGANQNARKLLSTDLVTTLFPGSLFSASIVVEKRPWLTLATCLPESGRFTKCVLGDGLAM